MTIDQETMIRLAEEVGFAGYGEDAGMFSIPVPAFYSRLGRFAALVLEHGRKPLTEDQIDAYVERADVHGRWKAPFAAGVRWGMRYHEYAHGITNKESSDVG